jgi:hypothetical protein
MRIQVRAGLGRCGTSARRAAGALLVAVVLAGTLAGEARAQGIGTVIGTVTQAGTTAAVAGASIRVIGGTQSAVTRADGTYGTSAKGPQQGWRTPVGMGRMMQSSS